MHNFPSSCRIWKHVNAKHRIAIVIKTLTGQCGFSVVLQQLRDESDQQCKFLDVQTALCGVMEH